MGNPRSVQKKNTGADSELHAAARAGDLRAVESICSSDPLAVNSRDKHSRTPLHLAAWSGYPEIVSYLCQHKADARASAADDTSAIHFASQKGHVEVVKVLISLGVSAKSATRKGMTPLHFAVQGSHFELVKYLIRKGANLDTKNKSGDTPLDLVKSEEMRLFIAKCTDSPKSGDQVGANKADEPPSKLLERESNKNTDGIDGSEKRKGEDVLDQNPTDAKKMKVPLAHLVAEDDLEEEVL
ncbi:hypothetical protein KSP39_PZI008264 [Platanthera zijinensis]|uniref:Uncharacterized protein n=1 Tax=Platanthera zijinensis TaxID=2320716 RepID=A0AAP0BNW2_9ASPA